MNQKGIISILFFILSLCTTQAQVSGVITDSKTGKPIKDCDIFINNTSIHTTTNSDGAFELNNLNLGFYDFVIYNSKYDIFKSPLQIKANKAYKLNLPLNPSEDKSKSTKAKQDEEWKSNMEWFRQGFLGPNENISKCTIVNERMISFETNGYKLKAIASEPLIIENNALGYRITYHLQSFEASEKSATMQGLGWFEELKSEGYSIQNSWNRERQKAFWGSSRHFFQSLARGDYENQGYKITDEKGKELKLDSMVRPSRIEGYNSLDLPKIINVNYIITSGKAGVQPENSLGQHSVITKEGAIDVSTDGVLLSAATVNIEGELNRLGLSSMVPLNYNPEVSIQDEKLDWQNFSLLQEKVYIHTDRDYYYPRETIWFKAYLGFSMPILRDTLSRLLYVDFVSPSGKILYSKNLKIRNGIGWGEFVLPPTMDNGEYYIRAYTNWMRNYNENEYIRPIPILGWSQNLTIKNEAPNKNESGLKVSITADKEQYHSREKISLSVDVLDPSGKPSTANFSIAVLDAQATTAIPQINNITAPGQLEVKGSDGKNEYFESIEHFMERGISFTGKVVDNKGINATANIAIVQGNMDNLINLETDHNGAFLVTGLDFFDSLNFAFKSTNTKGKLFGKVELIKKELPKFSYNKPKLNLEFRSDDALQRVQNTYDLDKNTIMLGEVIITDKAIDDEAKMMPKVYGKPDYVVKGSDMVGTIAGSNPLIALQGRVPGLQVTEYFDEFNQRQVRVKIRGGTSSIAGNTDPLIMVDGVLWGGPNELVALSPQNIDYVEVITRGVSLYGSRGSNGIIAIYTKQRLDATVPDADYVTHKIGGYSRPLKFSDPDYSSKKQDTNADFRTTLYWNPNITSGDGNPGKIVFYSADVETQYKIVVEGITKDGVPFRGLSYITISR